jgi:mannose-6-phosphate isomerase
MENGDLRINVLGTVITISANEEPEYLEMLLDKYRRTIENVQRISGLKDPLKIAVLTGYLLCDDLQKAGIAAREEKGASEAEELTLGMISRLEEVVAESEGAYPIQKTPVPEENCVGAKEEIKYAIVYRLQNVVKNYHWGSPEWIPALLKQRNVSRVPWAEYWMGVNSRGPSHIISDDSGEIGKNRILLSELIKQNPETFLGRETAHTFGALPFLFKVLAVAKPLSIQTHPNHEQARDGFERENREGIPMEAPNRNYVDPNHKPEIICALSPFAALCGFREVREICFLLEIFSQESNGVLKTGMESLISALSVPADENPLKTFLRALFSLGNDARQALGPFIKTQSPVLESDFPEYKNEWELCFYLAGLYPGDPAVIAPLYLNAIELAPGEAIYLPAGVLHSYIHGLGMELMADSDNVLRGGLTSKFVDPEELSRVLKFSPFKPEILKAPDTASSYFSYLAPAEEFSLSVLQSSGGSVAYPESGPSILLLTDGNAVVTESGSNAEFHLETGDSVFIPAGSRGSRWNLVFSGTFTAYVAGPGKRTV